MKAGKMSFVAATMLSGLLSIPVLGQVGGDGNPPPPPPPGGQQDGGGGGRRQRMDPAEMRQRMLDRLKQTLGASDDEFAALQPKIEKVQQLSRDANPRGMMFGGRGGGPGGPGGPGGFGGGNNADAGGRNRGNFGGGAPGADQPASDVQTKVRELQQILENKDAKADEIKAKLDALRQSRSKAREELTKAQQELRELLSQRQEAVLVTMGMLE